MLSYPKSGRICFTIFFFEFASDWLLHCWTYFHLLSWATFSRSWADGIKINYLPVWEIELSLTLPINSGLAVSSPISVSCLNALLKLETILFDLFKWASSTISKHVKNNIYLTQFACHCLSFSQTQPFVFWLLLAWQSCLLAAYFLLFAVQF